MLIVANYSMLKGFQEHRLTVELNWCLQYGFLVQGVLHSFSVLVGVFITSGNINQWSEAELGNDEAIQISLLSWKYFQRGGNKGSRINVIWFHVNCRVIFGNGYKSVTDLLWGFPVWWCFWWSTGWPPGLLPHDVRDGGQAASHLLHTAAARTGTIVVHLLRIDLHEDKPNISHI